MKKIYLDYAATTPVDKRVQKAMMPYFGSLPASRQEKFGNTMSLHSFGQEAKLALENSRAVLADLINAKPNEIIFTSSATESNNTALKGIAFASARRSPALLAGRLGEGGHIIISPIEHPCIMESSKWLKSNGFEITKIPVDKYGMVNPEDVRKAITDKTILVSVIHASNEIGTIEPIEEIGKICREEKIYFHTDASQSFGKIPIDVKKMNIDLLTASSHKIYGPKGAGLLYIREGIKLAPLLHGGGQENGLRSSTSNVSAIVGFAKAAEICQKEMRKPDKSRRHFDGSSTILPKTNLGGEQKRQEKLRDYLIKNLLKIKGSYLNGPPPARQSHSAQRLANNVNARFDFIEGEALIIQLDMRGIACSTGSACSSASLEPSHVLLAIGLRPEQAHGSLRISLGRQTTKKDIDYLLKVLPKIIKQLRDISPYGKK